MRKHIIISVIGLTLGNLLYYYFSTSGLEISVFKILEAIYASVFGVFLAYLMLWISQRLDQYIPWRNQLANRFISGIFLHFIVAYFLCVTLIQIYKSLTQDLALEFQFTNDLGLKLGIIFIIIAVLYTIIYFALYSYYTYASYQIESIKVERQQIDLQLRALKSQLSAHFLFNNLNAISELAHQDQKATEKYIRELAQIYNYSLKSYHSKLVPFNDELDLVKSYLEILKTRYGSVFKYEINITEDALASNVPALTLQMLVENAIKHNQMLSDSPLEISIFNDKNQVIITNNITISPRSVQSFHIGIDNIKKRYKLLCNKPVIIEKTSHFIVKLPLII